MPHPHPIDLGDIVLVRDAAGVLSPAIVTSVIDADHLTLAIFSIGGATTSGRVVTKGSGTHQWQRRPTTMERLIQQSLTTPERP